MPSLSTNTFRWPDNRYLRLKPNFVFFPSSLEPWFCKPLERQKECLASYLKDIKSSTRMMFILNSMQFAFTNYKGENGRWRCFHLKLFILDVFEKNRDHVIIWHFGVHLDGRRLISRYVIAGRSCFYARFRCRFVFCFCCRFCRFYLFCVLL